MSSSKKNNFLVQGGILAVAGILVRIIGLLYRVPLQRIIGDAGNSLYDSAYSIYSMILIISSYSIPVAVSKLISAFNAKHQYRNSDRVFKCSMVFACCSGLIAAILCYVFAPQLVTAKAVLALRILSPVIFFSAILSVLRGLFQGQQTMIPTSISQIIEQIFNAAVSIIAALILVSPLRGTEKESLIPSYGAGGSTIGTSAGVLSGLLFCLFVFIMFYPVLKKRNRKDSGTNLMSYSQVFRLIIVTITPVLLSTFLYNVSPTIDNYLIYVLMEKRGYDPDVIAGIHGVYTGKYLIMVNVPVAFANSFSSALIPSITAANAKGDNAKTLSKMKAVIKVSMMIAIPCAFGLAVLGGPIIQVLFHDARDLPRNLLLFGSVFVILFSMATVTNAVLQATDHLNLPVIHSTISLIIHTAFVILLVYTFDLNVWGLLIATILFALILCVLNTIALRRLLHYKQEIVNTFLKPLLSSILMAVMIEAIYVLLHTLTHSVTLSFAVSMLVGIGTYFVLLLVLRGVTENELLEIPKGRYLVKLAKLIHLM